MKVIEILKLNRGVLEACRDIGIRLEDVKYIDLYCDYNRLRANGEKVSYIVAVLAEKYGVCAQGICAYQETPGGLRLGCSVITPAFH